MRIVILTRIETGGDGTFGTVKTDSGFECVSVELPWRDNARERSCIPPGTYLCEWDNSPRFGECYHVRDVPGRSNILIHVGNWGGDSAMNFRSSVSGCIALGEHFRRIRGQKGVDNSADTLEKFETDLAHAPFLLTIR